MFSQGGFRPPFSSGDVSVLGGYHITCSALSAVDYFSSIVFSDEGEILKDQQDPDIAYNQLIRPGKSMLGLFYIEKRNFIIDIKLIYLTVIAIISKEKALNSLVVILKKLGTTDLLIQIASRKRQLVPMPPPGAKNIVTNREGKVE